ncbi:MAG: hypothetical protein LBB98_00665 [Treponema sp.]|nr:hypothetical protein [Treponema sp.]
MYYISTITVQRQAPYRTQANIYDSPKKPPKPLKGGQFHLDFAYSQNAMEIDAGIRETIRGVNLSIVTMVIVLYRI